MTHLCLPVGMSADTFLSDYWQKKPLLIKNGLPALVGLFEPSDILELATDPDVSARLISYDTAQHPHWQVQSSPFGRRDFKKLPKHWTVLIQNMEAWSSELGELWRAFDFIPKWQQDDIMVSYAPDGGGVGEHFDEYDVFLAQGYGRRRWQLGKMCDNSTTFVAGEPIKVLDEMGEIVFDEILEAGDVLYVPPRLAHYGVAVGECLTFSFGFRRPSAVQLLDKIADVATSYPALFAPFTLPQIAQTDSSVLSSNSITAIKNALFDIINSQAFDKVLIQATSELTSRRQYEPLAFYDELSATDLEELLTDGATLSLNHASRFVKTETGWFINGEQVDFDNEGLALLDDVLAGGVIDKTKAQSLNIDALVYWVNNHWLAINEAD